MTPISCRCENWPARFRIWNPLSAFGQGLSTFGSFSPERVSFCPQTLVRTFDFPVRRKSAGRESQAKTWLPWKKLNSGRVEWTFGLLLMLMDQRWSRSCRDGIRCFLRKRRYKTAYVSSEKNLSKQWVQVSPEWGCLYLLPHLNRKNQNKDKTLESKNRILRVPELQRVEGLKSTSLGTGRLQVYEVWETWKPSMPSLEVQSRLQADSLGVVDHSLP